MKGWASWGCASWQGCWALSQPFYWEIPKCEILKSFLWGCSDFLKEEEPSSLLFGKLGCWHAGNRLREAVTHTDFCFIPLFELKPPVCHWSQRSKSKPLSFIFSKMNLDSSIGLVGLGRKACPLFLDTSLQHLTCYFPNSAKWITSDSSTQFSSSKKLVEISSVLFLLLSSYVNTFKIIIIPLLPF